MAASDEKALEQVLASTLALLDQFTASLTPSSNNTTTTTTPTAQPARIPNPPDPLAVLRDAAALLRAHATKLGLLAINQPFTPSALTKVVHELAGTCLPAMLSAAQICAQDEAAVWGAFMRAEVHTRVSRAFTELGALLREVQTIATTPEPRRSRRSDSLTATGLVWASSDAVAALATAGIGGAAARKAELLRDTLRDAIEELREWREGTDTEAEGRRGDDGLLDSDDEGVGGDEGAAADALLDDIFHAAHSLPPDRPELRALVEAAEARLKKVVLLYAALVKRRLAPYRAGEGGEVAVLDELMVRLARIPDLVDELAGCFYELDEARARDMLRACVDEARGAAKLVALGWRGQEDEFTAWSRRWSDAMG